MIGQPAQPPAGLAGSGWVLWVGGHQEPREVTPVYMLTGLWVDGQGQLPSLLPNSCAAVGVGGQWGQASHVAGGGSA